LWKKKAVGFTCRAFIITDPTLKSKQAALFFPVRRSPRQGGSWLPSLPFRLD
jgi:hypothetical protein